MSREQLLWAILGEVRANQVLTDMLDEAAAEVLGINRTDARALDVIDQKGRITAGDLARELRMSTGAVTTLVDRLERAGFARRTADSADRRRVLLEVTPAMHKYAERIYGKPETYIPAWADYTDDDLEVVLRFQHLTRDWLRERLANAEKLAKRRKKN